MRVELPKILVNCPPKLIKGFILPYYGVIPNSDWCWYLVGGRASGKTQTGVRLMLLEAAAGKKVAAGRITENKKDTIAETIQSIQEIEGDRCGVRDIKKDYILMENGNKIVLRGFNPSNPESARGFAGYDLVLVDECFTGDTRIMTPDGEKRIDSLRAGDKVISAIGEDEIVGVDKKLKSFVYEIRVKHGNEEKIIRCSERHKFLTTRGWCYAKDLAWGDELISLQDMPGLWGDDNKARVGQGKISSRKILQSFVLGEARECYEALHCPKKSIKKIKRDWAQAAHSWWKWAYNGYSGKDARGTRGWVEDGVSHQDGPAKIFTCLSTCLQSRFRKFIVKISNRVRRKESLCACAERGGQEKGCVFTFARVESIKVKERRGGFTLYDLAIKGHPSYFAEGFLTHNCQYGDAKYFGELRDTMRRKESGKLVLCANLSEPTDAPGEFVDSTVGAVRIECNYVDNPLCPKSVIAQAEWDREHKYEYYMNNWMGKPLTAGDMAVFRYENLEGLKSECALSDFGYVVAGVDFAPGSTEAGVTTDPNVMTVLGINALGQRKVLETISFTDTNPLAIVGRLVGELRKRGIKHVIVDSTGAGEFVVPLLSEQGFAAIQFFGEKKNLVPSPKQKLYLNNRAYAYFLAAQRALDRKLFCRDEKTISELSSQVYKYTNGGMKKMEPKADIKKRIKHSPDRADSLVMANLLAEKYFMDIGSDVAYPNLLNSHKMMGQGRMPGSQDNRGFLDGFCSY